MSFIVVLKNDTAVEVMAEEFSTRLNADSAASDALKSHRGLWDATKQKQVTATEALIAEIVAHAETTVAVKDRK